MDTNGISADETSANAVNTATAVAPIDAPPTPMAETVPAPQIEASAGAVAANTPLAPAPTIAQVVPAAVPAMTQAPPMAAPVIAQVAPAAEPAIFRPVMAAPPTVTVAGLEPTRPMIPNAGLWRRTRSQAPAGAGQAARAAAKPEIPVITPPVHESGAAARAAPSRSGRFALLAASIALVAGLGAAAGAAGFAGVTKLMAPAAKPLPAHAAIPAPLHRSELAEETRSLKETLAQVRANVRLLADSIAGVRTNIDNAGKASGAQVARLGEQMARLHETVERLERSQSEPAARLAKVTETLERLERRAAVMANAPEPAERRAASTAVTTAAPAATAVPPAAETTTATLPPASTAVVRGAPPDILRPPVVEGWAVRRVFGGVAYLEGPDRVIEVEPGDNIRGVGRVEDIRRQGSRWVVVTNRGLIVSR